MSQVLSLAPPEVDDSPLVAARVHRKLTREKAAERAALSPDEVIWLEEGRLYRFATPHRAVTAAVSYATSLGINEREARSLAGLPVPPRPLEGKVGRLVAGAAIAVLALVLLGTVVSTGFGPGGSGSGAEAANLPPPWRVSIDVFNGSGDINHTRRVADKIGSLAYHVERVTKAGRFDYPETAVYYPPGGKPIAERLAEELDVATRPLPGGKNPRRLVVIVGPARVDE